MEQIVVGADDVGQRLDIVINQQLTDVNRSTVKQLIDRGEVKVNDQVPKAGYKLRAGDKVVVDLGALKNQPDDLEIETLYEDADCLVLNKPSGILTHSKGAFNPEATIASFIRSKLTGLSGERAGIVHRLDRGTSGVIICAKTAEAMSWLQKQFSTRKVMKSYVALVDGHLDPQQAVVDVPIARNPRQPQQFMADPNGRPAKTTYKVIKDMEDNDLVQMWPETGRTHQLRVHMAYLKHPMVGDHVYGGPEASRLMLHAKELALVLPDKTKHHFEAPLPVEFGL